jgi:ABC-type bacteriocin/lantibiotic exporter with double-glycine peptidase domain
MPTDAARAILFAMQLAPEGPIREEDKLGKAYDARLMRRLLAYIRPYRGRVVIAVGMLVLASGLELVGPWLTKVAIDDAIPNADYGLLAGLTLAFALALTFSAALEYARTLLTTWIGQRVMKDLRGEIFRHLQRLQLSYFDRNPVGRVMTRVTSDVEVLNEMFTSGVVAIFGDIPLRLAVSNQGAAGIPRYPASPGPDQRVPSGAHQRHVGRPALPAGAADHGTLR